MEISEPGHRKYTWEEKQQLLANLDFEVAHRTRRFESWLSDVLESFRTHQENQISHIPRLIRNITMREFGEKYNGNMQAAVRGLHMEKFTAEGPLVDANADTRKRKWIANQETEGDVSGSGNPAASEAESSKGVKNARLMVTTPKKPSISIAPGTAKRTRLVASSKTPGTSRTMGRIPASPSPQKFRQPFNTSTFPRPPSRPASPAKPPPSPKKSHINGKPLRPPSSATFNPVLPKTPAYPGMGVRLPRRDESMLSLNGSPLANPYDLGLGWFRGAAQDGLVSLHEDMTVKGKGKEADSEKDRPLKRSNSIVIRRDPSFSFGPGVSSGSGYHSRTGSQASIFTSSSQTLSPPSAFHLHSRLLSETTHTQTSTSPEPLEPYTEATPKSQRPLSHIASAFVAIPTKDGHLLEFDPLQTSPGAIDALDGITDSAKKQAREEMGRLIQATVDKWKIT